MGVGIGFGCCMMAFMWPQFLYDVLLVEYLCGLRIPTSLRWLVAVVVVSVGVGVVVVVVPLFRFVSCSSRGSKCSSTSMVRCESRTASSEGQYEAGSGGSGVVAAGVASVVVQLRYSVRAGQRVGRGRTKWVVAGVE